MLKTLHFATIVQNLKTTLLAILFLTLSLPLFSQITFGDEVIINPNADNARWVDVVDMEGDGDMDVVSASQNDDRIAWYENDGSENFTQYDVSTTFDKAVAVEAGDLDGDGDIDLAASSFANAVGRVSWFRNDGLQNFTQIDIQLNVDRPHSITINDIDNDGDIDLLVPVRDSDQIRLYTNDGAGNFTITNVVSGAVDCDSPRIVWVDDVDGDGDKDFVFNTMLNNSISWAENDGSQNFTANIITTGNLSNCKFVSSGDVDGDGDIDILSATPSNDRFALHRNDGSQNFTYEIISSLNTDPFCIVPVDLDFDGDLDLLTANKGDDYFSWYVNDGSGNFGLENIISGAATCDGAVYITPEDLDGDGDIDAIVAADTDDDVSWFVPPITLPIEGLQFYGKQYDRYIDLFWTTEAEIDNDYFDVERSIDGQTFQKIGQVQGNGNSTVQQSYALTDDAPYLGMNYYRLRQVDFNGAYKYSNIIAFEYNGDSDDMSISVYPNPASEFTNVLFNAQNKGACELSVYNALGQIVYRESQFAQHGLNVITVNLSSIKNGVYMLSLRLEGESERHVKLLKK